MSYRYMRMILFFDLPTETSQERREYTRFRKYLLKSGFMMMQESVYCKIALNQTVVNSLYDSLQKNKPGKGLIQVLTVTEKQFSKMEFILGEYHGDIINTDERFVEL
jgi:CRISPR-associated protein Cas2